MIGVPDTYTLIIYFVNLAYFKYITVYIHRIFEVHWKCCHRGISVIMWMLFFH